MCIIIMYFILVASDSRKKNRLWYISEQYLNIKMAIVLYNYSYIIII